MIALADAVGADNIGNIQKIRITLYPKENLEAGATIYLDNAKFLTRDTDVIGTSTITYKDVPAGSDYKLKFAANGSWNDNWGKGAGANEAAYNGQDIPLEITYDKADVTLKLDLTNYNHTNKQGATYSVTVTEVVSPDYYLIGYINGANYGCENDYSTLGIYKFVNGKLTVTFNTDSYVGVKKTYPNGKFGLEVLGWYMTDGWRGEVTSAVLYNTDINANPDKLRVVVFALKEAYGMTIVDNANVCAVGSSADYMLNE